MRMKFCALLLCASLLLTAGSAGATAAEGNLIFISINEWLPPELINCVTVYDGVTYVPYTVFSDYGLGISYTYFVTASTAYLSTTKDRQLFFEVTTGKTYDGEDNAFSAPAILRSGVVYLPVGLVCSFFGGLNYTLLPGNQYGSILRITSPAVVLNDDIFVTVAEDAMRSYSRTYLAEHAPVDTPPPLQPTYVPENHEGDRIYLSFVGLPEEALLSELEASGVGACFFLNAWEIAGSPDLVRRLAGEGFGLGVYCEEDAEQDWLRGSTFLYEAARFPTVMVAAAGTLEPACLELAGRIGLICCVPGVSAVESDAYSTSPQFLLDRLSATPGSVSLRLDARGAAAETAVSVLRYLEAQRYEVVCPGETDGTVGG